MKRKHEGGGRNTNTATRVGEVSFRLGETWVYVPAEFLRNRANQKQGLYQGQGKSFTKPTQYFSTPNRDTVWAAAATMILDECVRLSLLRGNLTTNSTLHSAPHLQNHRQVTVFPQEDTAFILKVG